MMESANLTFFTRGTSMHEIIATLRNGHLELPEPVDWPDGTRVRVVPLANRCVDRADSSAAMQQWPDGFLDQIREQWGHAPFEHPPQGEFELREDW